MSVNTEMPDGSIAYDSKENELIVNGEKMRVNGDNVVIEFPDEETI